MTETQARQAVASAYRALGAAGLIAGNSGNVSIRVAGGMVISSTGATAELIDEAGLVRTTLDASAPRASSEWALHAVLFRARPELGAIVHTHSDACTALACLGEALPAFHYLVAGFGGDDVRCAPYATFGTPELAEAVAAAMTGRTACLLANHGMVAAGPEMASALAATRTLETLARQYLLARAAGDVRLLTAGQMAEARERFRTYG